MTQDEVKKLVELDHDYELLKDLYKKHRNVGGISFHEYATGRRMGEFHSSFVLVDLEKFLSEELAKIEEKIAEM